MHRFRIERACAAYQHDQVDLREAALMAGVPIGAFVDELAARHVVLLDDPASYARERTLFRAAFSARMREVEAAGFDAARQWAVVDRDRRIEEAIAAYERDRVDLRDVAARAGIPVGALLDELAARQMMVPEASASTRGEHETSRASARGLASQQSASRGGSITPPSARRPRIGKRAAKEEHGMTTDEV